MSNQYSTISPLDQSIRYLNMADACQSHWPQAAKHLRKMANNLLAQHESRLFTAASLRAIRLAGPTRLITGERYAARYVKRVKLGEAAQPAPQRQPLSEYVSEVVR